MNDINKLLRPILDQKESPQEAFQRLNAYVSSGPKDAAWNILNELFDLASQSPEYHDVLVQLVSEIAKVSPKSSLLRARLWFTWQEMHSSHHTQKCYNLESSTERFPPSAQKAINFTAFSACLLANDIGTKEIGIFAFLDLREALEHNDSHWEKNAEAVAKVTNSEAVVSAEQLKTIDVAIAAQWAEHGGERILRLRNEDIGDEWKGALERSTEHWSGEPGFSEKRWDLWREQLGEAAKDD